MNACMDLRLRRLTSHICAANLTATLLESLERYIREKVDGGEWPHAVTMVAQNGKLALLQVLPGAAEAESSPLDVERSLFRLYSMTKPIIAAAALALVDRGKLSLDATLDSILPEFAGTAQRRWPMLPIFTDGPKAVPRPAASAPTVRQLLMHTAGIMPLDYDHTVSAVVAAPGYVEATASEPLRRVVVLFCFVLFGLQLSVCLWWLQVPLRDLSDA